MSLSKQGCRWGWLSTVRIIAMAIVPARASGYSRPAPSPPLARKDGFICLAPGELRPYVGELRALVNESLQLRLFLEECRAPAAPFLLFRLKRQGFSRCRAEAAPEGIYLSANG